LWNNTLEERLEWMREQWATKDEMQQESAEQQDQGDTLRSPAHAQLLRELAQGS
jgi:hypothetical protein